MRFFQNMNKNVEKQHDMRNKTKHRKMRQETHLEHGKERKHQKHYARSSGKIGKIKPSRVILHKRNGGQAFLRIHRIIGSQLVMTKKRFTFSFWENSSSEADWNGSAGLLWILSTVPTSRFSGNTPPSFVVTTVSPTSSSASRATREREALNRLSPFTRPLTFFPATFASKELWGCESSMTLEKSSETSSTFPMTTILGLTKGIPGETPSEEPLFIRTISSPGSRANIWTSENLTFSLIASPSAVLSDAFSSSRASSSRTLCSSNNTRERK